MTYEPDKPDQRDAGLPRRLIELVEKLSINQHDIWVQKKIKDGYRYGDEHRDPVYENGRLVEYGTHPDLVPYERLSEKKKNYDRANVINTIRAILNLGYTIEKKEAANR